MRAFQAVAVAGLAVAPFAAAAPVTYSLNKDHTDIVFEISHAGFSNKHGWLRDVSGSLTLNADKPEAATVSVVMKAASVDTNHAQRDTALAGPGFLDAAKFSDISFVSTQVVRTGADTADITGKLTLHGITKPMMLHAKLNKIASSPIDGAPTAGFRATGEFRRSDYGVTAFLPMIGDEIAVTVDAEFIAPKR